MGSEEESAREEVGCGGNEMDKIREEECVGEKREVKETRCGGYA